MQKVDLLIFDLDGTLVDSFQTIVDSVNHVLERLKLPPRSAEEIRRFIGSGVEQLLRKTIRVTPEPLWAKIISFYERYFQKYSLSTTKLFPGVKDTLRYFQEQGKKMAIVTNRSHRAAVHTLDSLGILHFFSQITGGDDAFCLKPSSCQLDRTLSVLDVKDKSRAMMIGDMAIDIEAGEKAGVLTCGATYGIGQKNELENAHPDHLIDAFPKLKSLVS